MVATPASVALTYTKGGGSTTTGPVTVKLLPATVGSAPLTLDANTVPLWLQISGFPTTATAAAASGNITFTVAPTVAAAMATGNYTATVGIGTAGYATHLQVPVALTISNTAPGLTMKEGADKSTIPVIFSKGSATPIPTWTPYSSNEPIPFTAACTLTTTETPAGVPYVVTPASCQLNSTSGIAYTLGYALNATLDDNLFHGAAATYGNTVTVKVVVTPQTGTTVTVTYQYTLQPINPGITSLSPTSVAVPVTANLANSLVVLVNGTNFVGPEDIATGSSLVPTQVWLGSATNALTTGYVVLSTTELMITIPESSLPAIQSGKTSNTLAIGLANQTQTGPPATWVVTKNLNIVTAPVIYGITSTATYVQPNPGGNPNVAAYELISIFGDQFGFTTGKSANATLDANFKVPTSLTIGGTIAHPTTLSVTFKDSQGKNPASAPIVFANQNQINAIVPTGMPLASTWNVTVTSGANTSDSFAVNVVAADPGVFTLASDGTGPGAIVNVLTAGVADGNVNGAGHAVTAGDIVSIYLTGLGAPDSVAIDSVSTTTNASGFASGCVAISNAVTGTPGYLQIANSTTIAASATVTGWTVPKPKWTNIDGAVIQGDLILGGSAPCMIDPITVTFGTGPAAVPATVANGLILWAGFSPGSVAGLYQINVQIPPSAPIGAQPVQVTINPNSGVPFSSPPNALSPNTVTILLK